MWQSELKFHICYTITSFVQKVPHFLRMRKQRLREVKKPTSISCQMVWLESKFGFLYSEKNNSVCN